MSRESLLSRLGSGLGRGALAASTFGLSELGIGLGERKRQRELEERQQLGRILAGSTIPEFARAGGAEPQAPQQIRQAQLSQLGELGTPASLEALGAISPLAQKVVSPLEKRKVDIQERKLDIDLRDLERKEVNSQRQEALLQNLLGTVPTNEEISSIAVDVTATQGADQAIRSLREQRNKFLPALTVPGVSEVAKAKISEIDEQIKFQRQVAREQRKQKEKLTPEQSAKLALIDVGLEQLNKAEKLLTTDGKFNNADIAAMNFSIPFVAKGLPFSKGRNARSLFLNAINAQLRAESGAAVPEEEVQRAFERFVPQLADDDATKRSKIESLKSLLGQTRELSKGPTISRDQGEGTIATNPQTGAKLILRGGQWQPL